MGNGKETGIETVNMRPTKERLKEIRTEAFRIHAMSQVGSAPSMYEDLFAEIDALQEDEVDCFLKMITYQHERDQARVHLGDMHFEMGKLKKRVEELEKIIKDRFELEIKDCKHPKCCCVCGHKGKCPECGPCLIDIGFGD